MHGDIRFTALASSQSVLLLFVVTIAIPGTCREEGASTGKSVARLTQMRVVLGASGGDNRISEVQRLLFDPMNGPVSVRRTPLLATRLLLHSTFERRNIGWPLDCTDT